MNSNRARSERARATYIRKVVITLLLVSVAAVVQLLPVTAASEPVYDYAETGSWQLALAIGRGVLQSPLSDTNDFEVRAMPSIRYYGERFYLEDTGLGFSLYETPSFALDLAGRLNTDGLYFPSSGSELTEGLALAGKLMGVNEPATTKLEPPKRRLSYLGGISAQWHGPVTIGFGAYRDVTDVHGGDEIPLTLSRQFAFGRLLMGVELGATYQSRKLIDYYYGAEMPGPGASRFPLYQPGAALNTHATVEMKYPLTASVDLVVAGRVDRMDEAIAASPFVVDASPRAFFAGVQYSWK